MSVLAVENKAINLGQGFPDFHMDQELVELVAKAMRDGHNQYVHMNGLPGLRKAIAEKVFTLYKNQIDADKNITVTPGGTYAIYTALTAVLHPGDEVILFQPAYDSYIPNIEINGGTAIPINLEYPNYSIDWNKVREKITNRTRAIMLNTPHNPTGAVLSRQDIQELQSIVENTNLLILSDEVYEHLIFDEKTHESILKYPDLLERSFVCFSFGKVYHCTGWKLGYCIAPEPLMKEFRKVHQFNCFTCNSPFQFALAEYLQYNKSYLELATFLQKKRDKLVDLMASTKFKPLPSHGSYFQLYSYSDITDESEREFAIRLTKEAGVVTIPTSAFYKEAVDNKVLRFCFAKKDETLEEAAARLQKYQ
jgi:methionine transaminase